MSNPPRQKGTAAESAVRDLAKAHGIPAERVALAGSGDQGDVWLWGGRVVIEVKSRRSHPSWVQVDKWWHETEAEGGRVPDCDVTVLVVKRPGSGVAYAMDWFAWALMSDLTWWANLRHGREAASTVAHLTPQRRVMLPLGDLLALLKAGHDA